MTVTSPISQHTAVQVQEVTSFEEMKALVPEWAALWSRCGSATPFQTPEWLLPWWRLFGQPRLWVLAVHAGPELIGLAPLFVQENGKQRVVRFLGTGISDYADFLLASDFSPVAMDSICDFLGKKRESWDICDFENVPVESPLLTMSAPPAFAPPAFKFRHMPSAKCPIIVLPKTGEDWFQHLSYKTRRNLMHTRNVLASAGACFEKATQESLEEYLDALFRLHTMAWQQRGQPGVLSHPVAQQFCRMAVFNLMKTKILHFYGVRIHGVLRGALLCFSNARRMFVYLSGYDPAFSCYSPGTGLMAHAIEDSIQNGFEVFDFLRGTESYKYKWGAQDTESHRVLFW